MSEGTYTNCLKGRILIVPRSRGNLSPYTSYTLYKKREGKILTILPLSKRKYETK